MFESDSQTRGSPPTTTSILSELTMKMVEMLNKAPNPTAVADTASIIIKLDGSNNALWSQVVEIWRAENAVVKGWLINTMDSSLVSMFIRYPTTTEVWDAIAVTFFDGSDTAQEYFHQHGLIHQTLCPHTLEKKDGDECKNRHILETTRALLLGAHVPSSHWLDVVTTAVHFINRMPSRIQGFKTPLQALAASISVLPATMLPP
ncbi:Retrovirus-related Pol polyprotein from transposon RE1 [Vitis vinifera]|uniref:Retrovirus-related Pol polyprotein from transposon RE1 n=1 Tax=Vitis vinifera TaxID=29760 RepID=A0A438K6T5_VITVI|nr:Retrovirus-related Pol polyprotein from transposon RE1 [Vitis vinifera]